MTIFINTKDKYLSRDNFYGLLIFSLSFLSFFFYNKEQISLNFFFNICYIYLTFIFTIIFVSTICSKIKLKKYINFYNICLLFYLIFNFNNLKNILFKIFSEKLYFIISELTLIIIFIVFFCLIFILKKKKSFKLFLNRFILVYFLYYLISISYYFINYNINSNVELIEDQKLKLHKIDKKEFSYHNIYYIISDAAIDPDLFFKIFKNTNSIKLVNNLKKKGFKKIENSKSTFNNTHLSISSILNIDYPVDEMSDRYTTLLDFFPYYLNDYTPKLIKILKELNYRFYWQGNIWATCHFHSPKYCLSEGFQFNKNIALTFLINSPFYSIYKKLNKSKFIYDPNIVDEFIKAHKSINLKNKNFFLIHQFMPHGPHVYDKKCNRLFSLDEWNDYIRQDFSTKDIQGYENSYLCNLNKLNQLTEYIISNDPKATILLTSDHGYPFRGLNRYKNKSDNLNNETIKNKLNYSYSILNFIKTNNECHKKYLKNSSQEFDNINTTKLVLNCSLGLNLEIKNQKSYWGFLSRDVEFGKVLNLENVTMEHLTSK